MFELTEKTTRYELKNNWFDYVKTYRETVVKKTVLDELKYYSGLDEDITFKLIDSKNNIELNFTKQEFIIGENDVKKLSLFMASRDVIEIKDIEEDVNTGKDIVYKVEKDKDGKDVKFTKKEIITISKYVEIKF